MKKSTDFKPSSSIEFVADEIYKLNKFILAGTPNYNLIDNKELLASLRQKCIKQGLPHDYKRKIRSYANLDSKLKYYFINLFEGLITPAKDIATRIEEPYCYLLHRNYPDHFRTIETYSSLIKKAENSYVSMGISTDLGEALAPYINSIHKPINFVNSRLFSKQHQETVLEFFKVEPSATEDLLNRLDGVVLTSDNFNALQTLKERWIDISRGAVSSQVNNQSQSNSTDNLNKNEQVESFVRKELKRRGSTLSERELSKAHSWQERHAAETLVEITGSCETLPR